MTKVAFFCSPTKKLLSFSRRKLDLHLYLRIFEPPAFSFVINQNHNAMSEEHIIETLGSVSKVENLSTLNHSIIPNTFVIETIEPFPGYHGGNFLLDDVTKKSVFFILREKTTAENLCRTVAKIRKFLNFSFDAAIAEITVYNQHFNAIRIKRFEKIENINELQQAFSYEGFQFLKPRKINAPGIIKVKKYMLLKEYSPDIYLDQIDTNIAYFRLPVHLTWKIFEEITIRLKHNLPDKNFDVALGVIFRRTGLIDVVRIYNEKHDMNQISMLKEKYEEAIKRIL